MAAVAEGFDPVVAAGGDGTVNEVVNGLALAPGGLSRTRLGILPLGTINVFALELGLPLRHREAWAVIEAGGEARLDLPRVDFTSRGQADRRFFAQLAGAGLDARAIERVDWRLKTRVGPLAYAWAGIQALRGPQASLRADTPAGAAQGPLILLGNGRFYGGRINLFPDADARDGRLDVRVFPRIGWWSLLRFGWAWVTRQRFAHAGEPYFQTARVTLSCPERMPFELDGDCAGQLPATFSIHETPLRVIVPVNSRGAN
jgi:YegS/Rv2252/BmrU family lipid kinase